MLDNPVFVGGNTSREGLADRESNHPIELTPAALSSICDSDSFGPRRSKGHRLERGHFEPNNDPSDVDPESHTQLGRGAQDDDPRQNLVAFSQGGDEL